MPKMIAVEIKGLSANANLRLIEILEAGLISRSVNQNKDKAEADRKLVNYIISKLK